MLHEREKICLLIRQKLIISLTTEEIRYHIKYEVFIRN